MSPTLRYTLLLTRRTTPFCSSRLAALKGPTTCCRFLKTCSAARNVPRERMLEVAEHYQHFGGVSPINEQNRQLLARDCNGVPTRAASRCRCTGAIATGIRSCRRRCSRWRPMAYAARSRFFTSAFSSYSGCRQYRENIAAAQETVGPAAPEVDKLRMFYNHPAFVEVNAEHVAEKLALVPAERRAKTLLLFTAHSIPMSMAENCRYELQLQDACKSVAAAVGHENYKLVYQSRSGPPQQPWLEPDVCDEIRCAASIGRIAGHRAAADRLHLRPHGSAVRSRHRSERFVRELGVNFHRAATVGVHPKFVRMIADLVVERMTGSAERPAIGELGPSHDVCPVNCCTYTPQRPSR